ncbi:MAG: hypothetical protein J7M26_05495 [Armatimonadetes bacterium]|nr:hypothetical protein [Armatimonadota bacterium]
MKTLVIFELLGLGALLISLAGRQQRERGKMVAGAVCVLVGLLLGPSWIEVPPATVAAVYDPLRGGIQPYDLGEGWHIVPPWATVKYFSVRTQNYTMSSLAREAAQGREDEIICQTKEGLSLAVDATVLFHISHGDANRLWRAVGPNYVAVIVRPNAREATRIVISEYPIMSVYSNAQPGTEGVAGVDFYPGKRQEVEDRIFKRLQERLKEKGVTLERFLLRNVDYEQKDFEQAIVQKQVAQQRIVTQQYEAEIQRIRAQATVVRAEGDAEAIKLKAAALRIQPKVIEWELVEKLPEDLEVVILPDKVMPLIDLAGGTSTLGSTAQARSNTTQPPQR